METDRYGGIDLSGEDEFDLPPGVQQGSLGGDEGGDDIPPPKEGEYLIDPEAEKEQQEEGEPEATTPVKTSKPRAKKRAPKPAPTPPPLAPLPPQQVTVNNNDKKTSGTIDRPYRIFQIKPADVDGQILDVPVPVIFNDDQGGTMETLVARNRDLALTKAARAFGPDWTGMLIAVPIGMWEPKQIVNKPRNSFSVQIGDE